MELAQLFLIAIIPVISFGVIGALTTPAEATSLPAECQQENVTCTSEPLGVIGYVYNGFVYSSNQVSAFLLAYF